MAGTLAVVVYAMLGKLYRETMERTLMQARYKPLYHLAGNKLQASKLP
jgi:hypothetical protein